MYVEDKPSSSVLVSSLELMDTKVCIVRLIHVDDRPFVTDAEAEYKFLKFRSAYVRTYIRIYVCTYDSYT